MREFKGFKKGINLGGWLSQCGEENYNDEHYSTFITESDINRIAEMSVDHVRLPIDYNVVMTDDGRFIESGFGYIDNLIAMCRKKGLAVILDLHKTAGFVFDDASCCQFFSDEALQDMFVSLWLEFARRYGNAGDIAFELLNEITDPQTAQKWNEIAARTVKAIRTVSQSVRIIIGGIFNSSIYGLTLLDKPADENIVFTFHCYSPLIFTHQRAYWVASMPSDYHCAYPIPEKTLASESHRLFGTSYDDEFDFSNENNISVIYFERLFERAIAAAEKYNVPLYCGEYGVIDRADTESTVNWYRDIHAAFEKYDISRAAWTYKGKDYGLSDEHYNDIYPKLVELL